MYEAHLVGDGVLGEYDAETGTYSRYEQTSQEDTRRAYTTSELRQKAENKREYEERQKKGTIDYELLDIPHRT